MGKIESIEPVALQDLLDEGTTVEDVGDDDGEGNS
jgi:hypothetical protein